MPSFSQANQKLEIVNLSTKIRDKIDESFGPNNGTTYKVNLPSMNAQVKEQISKRGNAKLSLDIPNIGKVDFELQVNDLRGIPYRKLTEINTYKGTVNGDAQNQVRFYLSETYFGGNFRIGNQSYHVSPIKNILRDKAYINQVLITQYEKPKRLRVPTAKTESACEGVVLEMGMHATNAFYEYMGGDANPTAEDEIVEIIEDMTGNVAGFFTDFDDGVNIPTTILIRGTMDGKPIVWKEHEPWHPGMTEDLLTVFAPAVQSEWSLNRPCIPKDGIFVFAHENNYDKGGKSTSGLCENFGTVSYIDKVFFAHPATEHKYAHEIGHVFGAQELEYTLCADDVLGECDNPPIPPLALCDCGFINPLMCTNGVSSFDITTAFLDECSLFSITNTYNNNCNGCLGDIREMPTCPRCEPGASIQTSSTIIVPDCGDIPPIEVSITICNSCVAEDDIQVEAVFNGNYFNVTDLGDFEEVVLVNSGPNKMITRDAESFDDDECKTFRFTIEVIDVPTAGYAGIKVEANQQSVGFAKNIYFLTFDEIGDSGTESLEWLIDNLIINNNNTEFMPPDGCSNCGPDNCKNKNVIERLEIDIPEYCMDGFNFKMEPGSEIIVKEGSKLTISNSRLFACTEMWKGITVENGATLEMDNCTIEDAQYAIRSSNGNAIISVINSDFNRNFVGIYLDGPPSHLPIIGAFFGNTFDGGGGLMSPYSGQTAEPASSIGSKSFAGVWVKNKANPINSFENIFKDMSNGIYVNQTNLSINRNQFINIQENGYDDLTAGYGVRGIDHNSKYAYHFTCTGFGMNSETFSFLNCSKGIRIEGMNVGKINKNAMDVVSGIELVNCFPTASVFSNRVITKKIGMKFSHMQPGTNANIVFNDVEVDAPNAIGIQVNMMGIPPAGTNGIKIRENNISLKDDFTLGIESNGGNGLTVADNIVEADRYVTFYSGIRINNDQKSYFLCNTVQTGFPEWNGTYGFNVWDAEATKYSCNAVTNIGSGIAFEMGSLSPENFKENSFSGFKVGLFVSDAASIGSQTHRGNQWTSGSLGSLGAKHGSSDPQNWSLSKFTIHTSSTPYYPSLPSGQNDWFATGAGSPSSICPTCLPPSPPNPGPGDEELFTVPDDTIATGNFSNTAFNSEITKLANRYLFRKLSADTSLITTGGLAYASFYNTQDTATTGRFYKVEAATRDIYNSGSLVELQVAANFEDIGLLMDEISELDSLAMDYGGMTIDFLLQRDTALQTVQSLSNENDTLMQPIVAQRIADADTVEQQNGTITILGGDVPGWNEWEVNRIFLTTVAMDTFSFNETDFELLDSIAHQCPLTGGSAVFKARSLLALVRDSIYNDEELCEPTEERQNIAYENGESPFQIFPNPAQNEITLLLANDLSDELEVVIYNAVGAVVLQKTVPKNTSIFKMDVSKIGDGPILVSLRKGNSQIGTKRILIIH